MGMRALPEMYVRQPEGVIFIQVYVIPLIHNLYVCSDIVAK